MTFITRFYDPALGRFTSADSFVPGGVQGYDRYAYVNNNPLRYTDPSGHAAWNENEGFSEGSCVSGDLVCQLDQGGYEQEQTLYGIHAEVSITADIFYGKYGYLQRDYLFSFKTGTVYETTTVGDGTYLGTPNGTEVEVYGGRTTAHGIPSSANPEEVAGLLSGPNSDHALEAGFDAYPEVELTGGIGFSEDINPNTGTQYVTAAGPMYSIERKVGLAGSIVPFPVDGGVEWRYSQTIARVYYQIPW